MLPPLPPAPAAEKGAFIADGFGNKIFLRLGRADATTPAPAGRLIAEDAPLAEVEARWGGGGGGGGGGRQAGAMGVGRQVAWAGVSTCGDGGEACCRASRRCLVAPPAPSLTATAGVVAQVWREAGRGRGPLCQARQVPGEGWPAGRLAGWLLSQAAAAVALVARRRGARPLLPRTHLPSRVAAWPRLPLPGAVPAVAGAAG